MPENRDQQTPPDRPEKDGPDKGSGKPGPENNMKFSRSMLLWMVAIGATILILFVFRTPSGQTETVSLTSFWQQMENGRFQKIEVSDDGTLEAVKRGNGAQAGDSVNAPTRVITRVPATAIDGTFTQELIQLGQQHQVDVSAKASNSLLFQLLINLVPWILLFVIVWFFFLRQIRSAGGGIGMLGNFGRSRHRLLNKEHTNVTFKDVAGIEEAKEELSEIVEFLKNPKRFQRLGGRIPRGVLLIGDPGVGKTLLAKAIAGEADVPFFSISGSDFVEMFVGVGASRVRDLFKTAKEASPCIIFLDEIDAVGRRRGNGLTSGGHDEREQTLNAILVEMDGFDTNDQVIVIAATNRADVLDPALTRPGRFDRQVYVPLPDIKGRYEILKVHSRKVKLSPSVDLMRLARQTPMFSGADLAAIINESALMATMLNKDAIEMSDLEEARDKLRFGKARRSRAIDEQEKTIVAWHEAGHAIVQALQKDYEPLHKVSIIARGRTGGASFTLPEKDRVVYPMKYWLAYLRICYGGRVAEELFCGDASTGASMDIQQATGIARSMVRDWGMSEILGPVKFSPDENKQAFFGDAAKEYSDRTAELIDQEVRRLIQTAYEETHELLSNRRTEMEALKDALMKYETVDGADVDKILAGEVISKPTVQDLLASEQQRRAAEARREAERHGHEEDSGPGVGAMPQPG